MSAAPQSIQSRVRAPTVAAVRSPLNHSSRTRSADSAARPGASARMAPHVAGSMVKPKRAPNRTPRRILR